jgi:hypothetical protein
MINSLTLHSGNHTTQWGAIRLLDGIDERATLRTWARLATRRTQSR